MESAGTIEYIRLTKIFRQAQDSLIITNAHRINQGEFPLSYKPDARRDFIFIKEIGIITAAYSDPWLL